MPILARNPLDEENRAPRAGQIQGGPTVNTGPGPLSTIASQAAPKVAEAAWTSGTNAMANAASPTIAKLGTSLGGQTAAQIAAAEAAKATALGASTGASLAAPLATTAATSGGMAAMAPMLAAAGPFALMALPFLLNKGTNNVPAIDYGSDPLAQGYKDGTSCVGMNCNCASCKARKYNYGTAGVKPTTNMSYAGGTDSVPAMLTPGEAVIPAAAAQNPANKPMINSMVNEGRAANDMAEGMPQVDMTVMAGPLSGKAKREQMKLLQDMSFKKKAFEAEEQRKQQAFDQKMSQSKMQYMLAMRQSQE